MKGKFRLLLRSIRFWWQRRTRGWDDSVTWNLDQQLAGWLAPRLRRFRELNNGFPHGTTPESWDKILDEMVWAAEWYGEHAYDIPNDAKEYNRAVEGLQLVTTHLNDLWW